MTSITFDTLRYTKTLESGGFAREQAEAQVTAQREAFADVLAAHVSTAATKEDIASLKTEVKEELRSDSHDFATKNDVWKLETELRAALRETELRMTIRLGAMMAASAGLVVTLVKVLHSA